MPPKPRRAPGIADDAALSLVGAAGTAEQETVTVEDLARELGTEAYLYVYRKAKDGRMKYRGKLPANGFNLETLKESSPLGGTYQLRFFDANGKQKRTFHVDLDGPMEGDLPADGIAGGINAMPMYEADRGAGSDQLAGVIEAMQAQMKTQTDLITALIGRAVTPAATDPMDSLTKALALVKTLTPPPAPPAVVATPVSMLKDVVGMMKELRALAPDSGEGGGAESGSAFDRMVDKLLPAVLDAFTAKNGGAATPGVSAGGQVPGALSAPATPETPPPADVSAGESFATEAPVWLLALRDALPMLGQMHSAGVSAAGAAVTLAEQVPDELAQALLTYANEQGSDFAEKLVGFLPAGFRSEHGTWCRLMLIELVDELAPDDAGEDDESSTAGNDKVH